MLELVAIAAADPMSVPVWAVLVMSAAMYPLGFMLGAPCSECCGLECTECTFNDYDGYCQRPIQLYPNVSTSITVGDVTSTEANSTDNGWNFGSASCSVLFTYDGTECEITNLSFFAINGGLAEDLNPACECRFARYSVRLEVTATVAAPCDFLEALASATFVWFDSGACEPKDEQKQVSLTWEEVSLVPRRPEPISALLEYLQDSYGSADTSIEFDACECGACCDERVSPATCENNVAEHICEYNNQRVWQGVGTDCDPDPCT